MNIVQREVREMVKCTICGRKISGRYNWKGELYGKECWKKYALPELLALREKEQQETAKLDAILDYCLIETLRRKSLKNISNPFKLDFIPSIIQQFDEKGFLTGRQYSIGLDMLNGRDCDKFSLFKCKMEIDGIEYTSDITGWTVEEIEKKLERL